jgi:hypothetical protein
LQRLAFDAAMLYLTGKSVQKRGTCLQLHSTEGGSMSKGLLSERSFLPAATNGQGS